MRDGEVRPALFMRDDLFHPIQPSFVPATWRSALYGLMQLLHIHLYRSVLAPEDVVTSYGALDLRVKLPSTRQVSLEPDPEWLARLETPCESDHDP